MRFIFRPLASYAVHTRKWCRDIAAGIKGSGVVRRVLDGFLIQVTKRGDRAIADVIDLDGVLVCSTNDVGLYGGPYRRLALATKLLPEGNPTKLAVTEANPVFDSLVEQKIIVPSGYVGQVPFPAGADMAAVKQAGWAGTGGSGLVNATLCQGVVIVSIATAGSETGDTYNPASAHHSFFGQEPPPDDAAVRLVGIDLASFGFPNGSTSNGVKFATYLGGRGYVCAAADYPNNEHGAVPPIMVVLQYSIDRDPTTGNISVRTEEVFRFSEEDAAPEDRSTTSEEFHYLDHLPPLPEGEAIYLGEVVSGGRPDVPPIHIAVYSDQHEYKRSWSFSRGTAPPGEREHYARTFPGDAAAQSDSGLAFVFSTYMYRETPWVSVRYRSQPNELVDATIEVPARPALREVFYRVSIGENGEAKLLRLYASEISQTDPETWNNDYVQFYPAATVFSDGEPHFLMHKVSTRSNERVENKETGVVKYPLVGYRMGPEDSTLVAASSSGLRDIATPGLYPAAYHMMESIMPWVDTWTVDGETKNLRIDFGLHHPFNLQKRTWLEYTKCTFACHYAKGMAVVVVGDNGNYRDRFQLFRLIVVDVASGTIVTQSEPMLAGDTGGVEYGEPYTRWHVSCLEEGRVDDEGNLTHYAVLLLTVSRRFSGGYLFVAKDLSALQQVCATAQPLDGPVYYLGSPIAPAKVGRSTGRSFLKGKPVTP